MYHQLQPIKHQTNPHPHVTSTVIPPSHATAIKDMAMTVRLYIQPLSSCCWATASGPTKYDDGLSAWEDCSQIWKTLPDAVNFE